MTLQHDPAHSPPEGGRAAGVSAPADRRSREALTVLDAMRDVIVIADRTGTIIYVNAALQQVLGWSSSSLIGGPLTHIIPERLRKPHRDGFAGFLAGGPPAILGRDPVMVPALHAEGHEVELELSLVAEDVDDPESWIIGTLRETSARRRLERAESRSRYLALSAEVARRIALTEDVHTVAEAGRILLQAVGEMLGWEVAVLWMVDETGGSEPVHGWACPDMEHALPDLASSRWRFEEGSGLPGRVVAGRRPAWIEDVSSDEDFPRKHVAAEHGIRTAFAFPVHAGGRVFAVVEMLQRTQRPVDAVLLGIAAQIGTGVGQFLERRSAAHELSATKARKAAMLDASFDAVVTMNHQGRVVQWNPAATTAFGWTEDEAVGQLLAELIIPEDLRQAHADAVAAHVQTGVATILGRTVELPAVRRDGRQIDVEVGITRLPDVEPAEFIGFIRDITSRKEAERQLAQSRDSLRHVVEVLQESLLPDDLPDIEGLEVGAAYRPAGDGTLMGGDFYDLMRISDTRWAGFIGDVCGKGAEAATVTTLARYTLRTTAMQDLDPVASVRCCNEALLSHPSRRFSSLIHLTVDVGPTSTVQVIRAGHPPPVLVRADGTTSLVEPAGTVLGVLDDPRVEVAVIELRPGDALLCYTDGVTEAAVRGETLGEDGFLRLLNETAGMSARRTAAHLCSRVVELQGGITRDDVALLMLRQPA